MVYDDVYAAGKGFPLKNHFNTLRFSRIRTVCVSLEYTTPESGSSRATIPKSVSVWKWNYGSQRRIEKLCDSQDGFW